MFPIAPSGTNSRFPAFHRRRCLATRHWDSRCHASRRSFRSARDRQLLWIHDGPYRSGWIQHCRQRSPGLAGDLCRFLSMEQRLARERRLMLANGNQFSAISRVATGTSFTVNGQNYYSSNADPVNGSAVLGLNTVKPAPMVSFALAASSPLEPPLVVSHRVWCRLHGRADIQRQRCRHRLHRQGANHLQQS